MTATFRRSASSINRCQLFVLSALTASATFASAAPTTFYPQPEPSNQEQYLLERINVARANPAAEGNMLASTQDPEILRYYSHYGVDTNKLRSDFNGYAAKPPLAFNPKLMASARQHSLDQATQGYQGHDGSDGSHFDGRITAQGYQWHALGENVFAYVETPFFGHVGLNADWGVPDLGHRENIMNTDASFPTYKEIGISCVTTTVKGFGPLVVTEDFGTPSDANVAYLVGVVYNDLNGNGAYDEGEGLAGVTVSPDGGDYYTTTSASGGYVLPLPSGSGTLNVNVSGGSLGALRAKSVNYAAGTNAKLDFTNKDGVAPVEQPAVLPQVTITANTTQVTADGSGQVGTIVIKRKGNKNSDLIVALNVGGTAVSGVDYSALPSMVTIPAGAKSVTLTVNPLTADFTGVKKLKIKAAPAAEYTVNAATAKANIKIVGTLN